MANTIEVRAHNAQGVHLHTHHASSLEDVRTYCVTNAVAAFVDGYSIGGIGIVRVVRTVDGHTIGFRRLLGGEFVSGGPELIA